MNNALLFLFVNSENVYLKSISRERITFDSVLRIPPKRLFCELFLFDSAQGKYQRYCLDEIENVSMKSHDDCYSYVLKFFGFSELILCGLFEKYNVASTRRRESEKSFVPISVASQEKAGASEGKSGVWPKGRKNQFPAGDFASIREHMEVAFSLNKPEKYSMIGKSRTVRQTLNALLKDVGYIDHPIFQEGFDRIYIGNEFCKNLFPSKDTLETILIKCSNEGYKVSVVFPCVYQSEISRTQSILEVLCGFSIEHQMDLEIVLNDWGLLKILEKVGGHLSLSLGRLLNKYVKDPRISTIWESCQNSSYLISNNLHCSWMYDFLKEKNISRIEYDLSDSHIQPPPGLHSLHFPFYFVNLSSFCPMAAEITTGEDVNQFFVENCQHFCGSHYYKYPRNFSVFGFGNAVFGYDDSILKKTHVLKCMIDKGFDRYILTNP